MVPGGNKASYIFQQSNILQKQFIILIIYECIHLHDTLRE